MSPHQNPGSEDGPLHCGEVRKMDPALELWLDGRPRTNFAPGAVIIPSNPVGGQFGYILSGMVKALGRLVPLKHPRARIIDLFGTGHWIGTEYFGKPLNIFEYVATGPTEVVLADLSAFQSLGEGLLLEIGHQQALRLVDRAGATLLSGAPLKMRVLYRLHHLRLRQNDRELRITQKDLAQLVGSSQAHVSRALKDLVAQGLVKQGYGSYEIAESQDLFTKALKEYSDN